MKKLRNKTPLFIRIANGRFKVWKEKPEMMELIRQRATIRAKQIKDLKHRNLVNHISNWPAKITTEELQNLISELNYTDKQGTRMLTSSMINRLRRKGLVKYDAGLGLWINLTY